MRGLREETIELAPDEMLCIRNGAGVWLVALRGHFIVTQERDPDDHCVRAGECAGLDRAGSAIITTRAGALMRLLLPAGRGAVTAELKRCVGPRRILLRRCLQ